MSKAKPKNYLSLLLLAGIVLTVGWLAIFNLAKPIGINEVASDKLVCSKLWYYNIGSGQCRQTADGYTSQQINCDVSKNSCAFNLNQYLPGLTTGKCYSTEDLCKSSNPTCSQVAGRCVSKTNPNANTCVTYTNGCEQSALCATPYTPCGEGRPSPSVKPTPTPTPITKVLYFEAVDPCGLNSFSNISYDCTGRGLQSFAKNTCTNVISAMKSIQPLCVGKKGNQ